jgi:hypothetical protein
MTRSLVKGYQRDGKYWLDPMLDKRPQEEEEEEYHYPFLKILRPLPLPDHHHRHRADHLYHLYHLYHLSSRTRRHRAEHPWTTGNHNSRPHLLKGTYLLPRLARSTALLRPWPAENGRTEKLHHKMNPNFLHHRILVQVPQNVLTNNKLQNHRSGLHRGRNLRNHRLHNFLPPLR